MSAGTRRRTIRIDDMTWARAQIRAQAEGTDVSTVIRQALEAYAGLSRAGG